MQGKGISKDCKFEIIKREGELKGYGLVLKNK